jgi:hypothetical protein
VCLTVRFVVVVVCVAVSLADGIVALLSVGGAGSSGVVVGWVVEAGAVWVGTGCASCARAEVEESASAAAIAGRAPVRA